MSVLRRVPLNWSLAVGGAIMVAVTAMAAGADLLFPEDPFSMVERPLLWPGAPGYLLGTDSLGRDIASGLFHGARVSLLIGVVSSAVAVVVGTAVGAVAGFYRGFVDDALMRLTELFQTIPQFMLAIVLLAILGANVVTIVAALAAVAWPAVARLVRGEFLALREREFIQSCRVIGMSDTQIVLGQILPNAFPTIIVTSTMLIATAILMEAGLSFLGLGDANVMSWGTMIGMGKDQLREAWYITAIPGLALLATALGLNLFGEGLNDLLNPRLKSR